jgi:outer membrane lipoprotein-sorting protein
VTRDYFYSLLSQTETEKIYVMRRFATLIVTAGLLVGLTGASRRADAGASAQLLSGILAKMEKAHSELKSLRAVIIQQKTNTQIGTSDTDYGTLIYKPSAKGQGRLRIDYTKPDVRVFAAIGNNVIFYQPRINQALKSTVAKASKGRVGGYAQFIGLDGSIKSLAKDYHFEYVKDELVNNRMATQLHLVPKGKSDFTSIEIWVSQDSWLPVQYKFSERNGDHTLVKLNNLEPNIKLADEAFVVKLPNNTVIVDKI